MTQEIINVGPAPDDGQGDPIRTSFIKCNDNFSELYDRAQPIPPSSLYGKIGDEAGFYAYDSQYFYYCFGNYTGNTVIWAQVTQVGNISVSSIQDGTSSVVINGAGGNVLFTVANSSIVAVTPTNVMVGGDVSSTSNVIANTFIGNTSTISGISSAAYFVGDGSNLANITSSYGNSNVALLLTTYNGQLTANNISAQNTISATNITTSGAVSAAGNVSGAYVNGNGAFLTGVISTYGNANVAAYLPSYNGNLSSINDISLTGSLAGANIFATGNVVTSANIAASYYSGNGAQLTGLYANANVSAFLPTNTANLSANNISASGNLILSGNIIDSSISAVGNISGYYIFGNGSQLTGGYANANVAAYLPTYAGPLDASGITTGNIFAVGGITANTLSLGQTLTVNTGNVTTAIINGAGNTHGDIGQSNNYFNMVYAVSTTAVYADIAENYLADNEYSNGTVLSFGGEHEVTISSIDQDTSIAGIVSTSPAYCMNGTLEGDFVATVALLGRVPCLVVGPVKRGDMMVSAGNGYARSEQNPKMGSVLGKALQSFDGDVGEIEIVVGRL